MFKGRFQRIGLFILGGYLWLMMITLGTIVLETFMVYPNIFYNPPESFKAGLDFMKVVTPHDFFPKLGVMTWLRSRIAPNGMASAIGTVLDRC